MRCGVVVGIQEFPDFRRFVLEDRRDHDREHVVEVWRSSAGAAEVFLEDYIWTQSGYAMWTNQNRTITDRALCMHRVDWKGEPINKP